VPLTSRTAIYGRVSTGRQAESLDTQLGRLRAAAPDAQEFVDAGISGRGADRPAFNRLLAAMRGGSLDVVTVTKLDRLGRSAKAILTFFTEAEGHDVRVVVLDQAVDTSTSVGRMVRTVLAALAELEGDMISERTAEAMDALKAGTRGTRSGRPVGRPGIITPDLRHRILELRDLPGPDGRRRTWNQIARILHHRSGSLRKWYASAHRGEMPSVINGPGELRPTSTEHRPVQMPESGGEPTPSEQPPPWGL
jgi:DNA invertase Pin-like site-specific DNA recombinase